MLSSHRHLAPSLPSIQFKKFGGSIQKNASEAIIKIMNITIGQKAGDNVGPDREEKLKALLAKGVVAGNNEQSTASKNL